MIYFKKHSLKDLTYILSLVCITIVAFLYTFFKIKLFSVKIIVWLVWFILFCFIGYFTSYGANINFFISELILELKKVVWPSRHETIRVTMMVIMMVIIAGLILWAVDSLMIWIIAKIAHLS